MINFQFQLHSGSCTDMLAPLISRLQTLILRDVNISDKFLSIFDVDTLILTHIEIMINNGDNAKQPPQQFTRLKRIQIQLCDPTLVSHLNQSKSLEHMAFSRSFLNSSFFDETSRFENLRTLILFVEDYLEKISDMVKRLVHSSDLVLGYPKKYGPNSLLQLIRNGKSLRKLMIMFDDMIIESTFSFQARHMQQLSDIFAGRSNEKTLDVIVIGHENQISPFNVTFPTGAPASLKITCLLTENVESILNLYYYQGVIDSEGIQVIRDYVAHL